jgi:phospholipid/cholesterol/gamma-HCH transport system permease protein
MAAAESSLTGTTMASPGYLAPGNHADIHSVRGVMHCKGMWTLEGIEDLEHRLARLHWPQQGDIVLDGTGIVAIDTTGALFLKDIIADLQHQGRDTHLVNLRKEHQELLDLVIERSQAAGQSVEPLIKLSPVATLGRQTWKKVEHAAGFLAFLGETSIALGRVLVWPSRIRWRILFVNIENAGLNAMPIVALLCFLIGMVIAYQGGNQLKYYGANIFIVELVTLTMVRELAPLITAIIVAGRTGSAYTAQIGTMQVTEEVDALRTIGIDPFDILVLPKLLGLLIVLPLLSVLADILSIFGGMVVAYLLLDVSFGEFVKRIPTVVSPFSFLFGIIKAPAFAAVIALVGCYQGFQVRGGADSVGRQTTESVVQAIFLVIVVDALFAIFLGTKGF